jgi:hypothetical protein
MWYIKTHKLNGDIKSLLYTFLGSKFANKCLASSNHSAVTLRPLLRQPCAAGNRNTFSRRQGIFSVVFRTVSSRHSVIGTENRWWTGWLKNRGPIPASKERSLANPCRPEGLWSYQWETRPFSCSIILPGTKAWPMIRQRSLWSLFPV